MDVCPFRWSLPVLSVFLARLAGLRKSRHDLRKDGAERVVA